MNKPTIRNIRRTFNTVTNCRLDGIIIDRITHTVILSADAQGVLTAQVDGVSVDVATADRLLCWAREDGSVTIVDTVREGISKGEAVEGITTREAAALHRTLARWGVRSSNHLPVAMSAIGRKIKSFTELAQAEISIVTRHASALMAGVAS